MSARSLTVALVATAFVAACGGDDDTRPAATSEVPGSASQSVEGFIAYLVELTASPADSLEPVDTSNVTGPTDETSEPIAVSSSN